MSFKKLLSHSCGRTVVKCLIILTNLGLFSSAFAQEARLNNYAMTSGLVDIQPGALVEGSARQGGIQPDYYVDTFSDPIRSFLEKMEEYKNIVSVWERVGKVSEAVYKEFFKYRDYKNPYYRRLLKEYRDQGKEIPLSKYGVCQAGVCREYALVLHFALKAAGVPNQHAYAKIERINEKAGYTVVEDHAFVVVKIMGKEFAMDSYYGGFHGYPLADLMSENGVSRNMDETRRIIEINNFPRIFNPKFAIKSCSKVF